MLLEKIQLFTKKEFRSMKLNKNQSKLTTIWQMKKKRLFL